MKAAGPDEQEWMHALTDTDLSPERTEEFITCLRSRKMDRVNRILAAQRSKLLADLHEKQDKLFNIDYLIMKIKSLEHG